MNATDTVIGSTVVVIGSRAIADTASGHFTMGPIVSGFLLGSALLLLAFVSPFMAKGFAILAMIGALLKNGPAVFAHIGKIA